MLNWRKISKIKREYNFEANNTDNASAISICRKRRYKESFNEDLKWHTFYKVVGTL